MEEVCRQRGVNFGELSFDEQNTLWEEAKKKAQDWGCRGTTVKMKMQSIEEMLAILKSNPNTLGLVEYGSPHESDNYETGDYDLFVILQDRAHDVESLHFYIKTIPVDLNIRSLQEIQG